MSPTRTTPGTQTSRSARSCTPRGPTRSPHALSRGNAALSTRATRAPALARTRAATLPAGPAPTTTTSKRSSATRLRLPAAAGARSLQIDTARAPTGLGGCRSVGRAARCEAARAGNADHGGHGDRTYPHLLQGHLRAARRIVRAVAGRNHGRSDTRGAGPVRRPEIGGGSGRAGWRVSAV